jgi:AcrR family transcriptional regulator
MRDAARDLFLGRGYAGTTMAAIAEAAGVAVPTVYWAFGSKRAIVTEIRESWLAQAETDARLRGVLTIREPGARLDAFGSFMANQWSTGAEALAVQRDAMHADPGVAEDVRAVLADRVEQLRAVTAPLAPRLRRGLTPETALDLLVALSLPEVYLELRERGWTSDRYAAWLGRTLRDQLLEGWSPIPG